MTEWLKVRAWKVRIPQKGIVGSNPAFSAEIQVIRRQQYAKTRKCLTLAGFSFFTTVSNMVKKRYKNRSLSLQIIT